MWTSGKWCGRRLWWAKRVHRHPQRFNRDVHGECGRRAPLSTGYPSLSTSHPQRYPQAPGHPLIHNDGQLSTGLSTVMDEVIAGLGGVIETLEGRRRDTELPTTTVT